MDCPFCHSKIPDGAVFCPRCGKPLPDRDEPSDFGYAAFISYRHLPRDTEGARQVQKAIETYRLPRGVAIRQQRDESATTGPKRPQDGKALGKCFRDEDELAASPSLPDSIQRALETSQALVIICSPDTQESHWVQREIETFAALHGRERIICVLADGDSARSIPDILKTRLFPDAHGIMRDMPTEPLAADLRPESKTKHKAELLRIIAAVAGCNFDDLRQRERNRRRNRRIAFSIMGAVLISLVTALAATAIHASCNARAAESRSLAAVAQEQLARGERMQAVQTALSALPSSSSDLRRPITSEAQKALEDALDVNQDTIRFWKPNFTFDANAEIVALAAHHRSDWVVILDSEGALTLVDVFTGATRATLHLRDSDSNPLSCTTEDWILAPAGPNRCVIGTRADEGILMCIDTTSGAVLWNREDVPIDALAVAEDGETFALCFILEDGTAAATTLDAANCTMISWTQANSIEALRPNTFATCAYDSEKDIVSLALGAYALLFFVENGEYELVEVGNNLISSLAMRDGMLTSASYDAGEGEYWFVDMPFMFTASDTSADVTRRAWTTEGMFSATVAGEAYYATPYIGYPRFNEYVFEGSPAAVLSAGHSLRILSLTDGHSIYQEDYPNGIVSVGKQYGGDNDFLAIALADGTLDIRHPLEPAPSQGDVFRASVPYQIDQAILYQNPNGFIVALLHTANQPNRMLSYRFDALTLDDSPQCTYDELISRGRWLLRNYLVPDAPLHCPTM